MYSEWVDDLNQNVIGCDAIMVAPKEGEAGDTVLFVKADKIKEVCEHFKNGQWNFNVLQTITGADYEDRIELSYILASFTQNHELILKTKLNRPDANDLAEIISITDIWKSADFLERECFDLLGVKFIGHPDLRRILCSDGWEGYPLRKDYKAAKEYKGLEIYPAAKMNFKDREFGAKQKAAEAAAKAQSEEKSSSN